MSIAWCSAVKRPVSHSQTSHPPNYKQLPAWYRAFTCPTYLVAPQGLIASACPAIGIGFNNTMVQISVVVFVRELDYLEFFSCLAYLCPPQPDYTLGD